MFARKLDVLPSSVRSSTTVKGEIEPPSGGGKTAEYPGPALEKSTPNSFKFSVFNSMISASITIWLAGTSILFFTRSMRRATEL